MQDYELMLVATPDFPHEDEKKRDELIKRLLTGQEVENLSIVDMGKKRLAYEIRKKTEGWYFLATFSAGAVKVGDIEKQVKLTPTVIRYLLTNRSI